MSKAYGLSGARLGWVVGAREIVLECAKLRDYVSICPSYIGERLSLALLRNRHKVLSRSNQIASTNFEIVKNWMAEKEHLIRWVAPQAGVVCFPWFAKPLDSMQACTRLIEQCSVLLVPGTCFAHPEHVRLGFGYSTPKLVDGLELFGQFLESNM
jgi:aspartate/methionine/tyrosine aminotransferase